MMNRLSRSSPGLSLLEVLFASVIMSAIAAATYLVLYHSATTYNNESMHLALDERAREILSEISRDLRESDRSTFSTGDPPQPVLNGQSYKDLRFGVISGYDLTNRKAMFDKVVRYRFKTLPLEIANGVDDDGNGLVDEGLLERADRFGVTTRISLDLRSPGLIFVPYDHLVKVTVILEKRDPKGTLIHREATTSIELRNSP